MKKSISIIIPTFFGNKQLTKLIESIITNPFYNDSFEIIIIDNSLNQSALYITELHSEIKYFNDSNIGVNYARNAGAAKATGMYLYFLKDNEQIEINTLRKALEIAAKQENYIYTGKTNLIYESRKEDFITNKLERYYSKVDYGNEEKFLNHKEWLRTGNLLVKKVIFDKLKGFETKYQKVRQTIHGEDLLFKRLCEKNKIKIKYIPGLDVNKFIPTDKINKEWLLNKAYNQGKSDSTLLESFKESNFGAISKKIIEKHLSLFISKLPIGKNSKTIFEIIHENKKGFLNN